MQQLLESAVQASPHYCMLSPAKNSFDCMLDVRMATPLDIHATCCRVLGQERACGPSM